MSDSTSSQAQTSTYTDNRVALGQGAQNANNGSSIITSNYTLDQQAVSRALDTVDKTVEAATGTQSAALGTVASFGGKVLDQVAGTEQLVASAYNDAKGQGALTQKILIAAVIGALAIAALAVQKKA